ncbi:hypothetical protein [Ensifer sp. SSB1]|jgi:hypothetical protein|nr:hypothetical protein [Ensifer sp. SSB1]MBK5568230.1 hypothetical protein [Ensifer sp. SSB1]
MRMLDGLKAKVDVAGCKVRAARVRMLDLKMLRYATRHGGNTSQGSIPP